MFRITGFAALVCLLTMPYSALSAQDNSPWFNVQPPQDTWEQNTGGEPKFSVFACKRVDKANFAVVRPEAREASIERLSASPIVRISREDALRLLGTANPGNGDPALIPYLIRGTGYDLGFYPFSIAVCGDTLWVASSWPVIPDATVHRLPLVIFLDQPPTRFYLQRLLEGK